MYVDVYMLCIYVYTYIDRKPKVVLPMIFCGMVHSMAAGQLLRRPSDRRDRAIYTYPLKGLGLGFWVCGLGLRVNSLGFGIYGLGLV